MAIKLSTIELHNHAILRHDSTHTYPHNHIILVHFQKALESIEPPPSSLFNEGLSGGGQLLIARQGKGRDPPTQHI